MINIAERKKATKILVESILQERGIVLRMGEIVVEMLDRIENGLPHASRLDKEYNLLEDEFTNLQILKVKAEIKLGYVSQEVSLN